MRRNAAMRGRRDGGSCFQIRNVFAALETDEYLCLFSLRRARDRPVVKVLISQSLN